MHITKSQMSRELTIPDSLDIKSSSSQDSSEEAAFQFIRISIVDPRWLVEPSVPASSIDGGAYKCRIERSARIFIAPLKFWRRSPSGHCRQEYIKTKLARFESNIAANFRFKNFPRLIRCLFIRPVLAEIELKTFPPPFRHLPQLSLVYIPI